MLSPKRRNSVSSFVWGGAGKDPGRDLYDRALVSDLSYTIYVGCQGSGVLGLK